MRGFFASDAPDDPEAYAVGDHLADMEAVLEAFGSPKSFILGGWSMGVQLSLESVHRNPERVEALLLVSGPYQRALEAVLPGVHPIFARGLQKAYAVGPTVTPLWLNDPKRRHSRRTPYIALLSFCSQAYIASTALPLPSGVTKNGRSSIV